MYSFLMLLAGALQLARHQCLSFRDTHLIPVLTLVIMMNDIRDGFSVVMLSAQGVELCNFRFLPFVLQ